MGVIVMSLSENAAPVVHNAAPVSHNVAPVAHNVAPVVHHVAPANQNQGNSPLGNFGAVRLIIFSFGLRPAQGARPATSSR